MTTTTIDILNLLQEGVATAVKNIYDSDFPAEKVTISPTRKEFEGDYTVVVFPFSKAARKKPEAIGEDLGNYLKENLAEVTDFNVIKGFLNLVISDDYWKDFLQTASANSTYGKHPSNGKKVMVEYSSPNTNKPLHLGHIRNILLGWSSAQLFEAAGYEVVKTQIVNDRGIAICKSMLTWQKFGNGATPESEGIKSDHFVGKFYVLFNQKLSAEYKEWQETKDAKDIFAEWKKDEKVVKRTEKQIQEDREKDARENKLKTQATYTLEAYFFKAYKNTYFNEYSQLGKESREMLLAWEANDPEVRALWEKMNTWVYNGFGVTYERLGVNFDKNYYESDTYILGKETVDKGLSNEVFYQKEDGSTWIDLTDSKLDHKIVLRADGTSVYLTQDLGTAQLRYQDFGVDSMIYVVGDEQNYHFQVLFEVLKRLGEPYADALYHLSYGMVDLPTGKMKSREGTVVDADDLIAEVIAEARKNVEERGELTELSKEKREEIIRKIGLGALKFFIIKVQPKKRMVFNPAESVDMQGQTGPYVQNAFVRIQSILRKAGEVNGNYTTYDKLEPLEKELLGKLYAYPALVKNAAENLDPSEIANYCYDLAKSFHKFYHDHSILKAESEAAKHFRLALSKLIAQVLENGMMLLGIEMPERM
ncbi:MAG: arginine--tRNA ligase [Bacteroidota bacterium]